MHTSFRSRNDRVAGDLQIALGEDRAIGPDRYGHHDIHDPERVQRKRFIVLDEGLKACGRVDRIVVGDGALLTRPSGYRLYVAVSLNPVSEELLERSREFSSNPKGGGAGRSPSLLGGVARLFHGDSTAGGETFYFRSQMLVRP